MRRIAASFVAALLIGICLCHSSLAESSPSPSLPEDIFFGLRLYQSIDELDDAEVKITVIAVQDNVVHGYCDILEQPTYLRISFPTKGGISSLGLISLVDAASAEDYYSDFLSELYSKWGNPVESLFADDMLNKVDYNGSVADVFNGTTNLVYFEQWQSDNYAANLSVASTNIGTDRDIQFTLVFVQTE